MALFHANASYRRFKHYELIHPTNKMLDHSFASQVVYKHIETSLIKKALLVEFKEISKIINRNKRDDLPKLRAMEENPVQLKQVIAAAKQKIRYLPELREIVESSPRAKEMLRNITEAVEFEGARLKTLRFDQLLFKYSTSGNSKKNLKAAESVIRQQGKFFEKFEELLRRISEEILDTREQNMQGIKIDTTELDEQAIKGIERLFNFFGLTRATDDLPYIAFTFSSTSRFRMPAEKYGYCKRILEDVFEEEISLESNIMYEITKRKGIGENQSLKSLPLWKPM